MYYPNFNDLVKSIPVQPAKNVFNQFPNSCCETFEVEGINNFYSERINKISSNPIVNGIIIGKANGRYQRDSSVIGLGIVELENQNFITPFYANSKWQRGFIDSQIAFPTNLKNFESVGDSEGIGLLSDIRDSDSVSRMVLGSTGSFASTYIGYSIFGGMFGIGEFIETHLNIPKDIQTIGLAAAVTLYTGFKEYNNERDSNYDNLVNKILDLD